MKKKSVCLLVYTLIFSCIACFAQVAAPYEVGPWQGFRSCAVSYTFDDNCPNQLAVAVPIFNEFGYKVTLFTITAWQFYPDWGNLMLAASQGHEIASHTMDHLSLGTLTGAQQSNELKGSQDTINSYITNITHQKCITLAYPGCSVGNESIVGQYYIAARTCAPFSGTTPSDFFTIGSIGTGVNEVVQTIAQFNSQADSMANTGGWLVYYLHAIDNDPGWSPTPSSNIRASLVHLSATPNKFWVTSFGTVAQYIKERNSISVSEVSSLSNSITIHVTDPLDNSIYHCPITIRRPLPLGWVSCHVQQHGTNLAFQITADNHVMVDVIPNTGDVTFIESTSSSGGFGSRGWVVIPKTGTTYCQTNAINSVTNGLHVVFPSGFSAMPVTFSVFMTNTGDSTNIAIASNCLALYRFTSSEEYSTLPVQFTLKYSDKMIPLGQNESQLGLYSFNGVEWVRIEGTFVASSNLFRFNSNKLSGEYSFFITDPNYLVTKKKPATPDVTHWSYNPFSPNGDGQCDVTSVELNLVSSSKVSVQIYDRSHSLIRDLMDSPKVSGKTYVEWDGKDNKGRMVAPGPYIYMIKINNVLRKGIIVVAY